MVAGQHKDSSSSSSSRRRRGRRDVEGGASGHHHHRRVVAGVSPGPDSLHPRRVVLVVHHAPELELPRERRRIEALHLMAALLLLVPVNRAPKKHAIRSCKTPADILMDVP